MVVLNSLATDFCSFDLQLRLNLCILCGFNLLLLAALQDDIMILL